MKDIIERLERTHFSGALSAHHGNEIFRGALEQARTGRSLVAALQRYIQFNSVFGGSVAHLAGSIAVRQDLFRDREEPVAALADRSSEVAALVFFAAVDEFGDHTANRWTHRSLAQATLRSAAAHFNLTTAELNDLTRADRTSARFARMVCNGYGLDRPPDERTLFRALGFHLGSELLADEEFRLLDAALCKNHPEMVQCMKQNRVQVGSDRLPAYVWVAVHTTVEAEHLDAGLEAANRALRFYAGSAAPALPREWVLQGFREFASVQAEFMESLWTAATECDTACA